MPYTKEFRKILEDQKQKLKNQIFHFEKQSLASLKDSVSELSSYDNHPADLGSETFERAKDNALVGNYKSILAKVDDALEKINNGTFGICELCGNTIDTERLMVVPYSTYCIDCQREEESLRADSRRPLEEDVLGPPFSRTFLDGTDKNLYDGEDAWQAVGRYGTSESPQDVPRAVNYNDIYIDADEERGIVDKADMIIDEEDPDEDDENELGS